ncbi:highly divergent homeobox isoform X4 [Oncorhynchus kisutch]|uniref:highly divergent homeobox isoform X4 n=1 Tax=Oncorhynchus kisutch TaxID=8019 RepID=UPI0012DDF5F6|nr:highly divergent homeobox isoform X4 [Oncorhynchus kisutch]
MADLPPCSSSSMEEWQEKRGLQTMNLRSVFTLEQQRVLDSYYDNGMTNQSKSCFQLILQCSQETKLDFSVVRTWVGNKRRKLSSRADQNTGMSHSFSFSNHSLAGGALSNHMLTGGALVAGTMLTGEMAAAQNIQRGSSHLPPSSSFPSASSSSSSPLSSVNNNNDVILTGIYSLGSTSRSQPTVKPLSCHSDPELPAHVHQTLLNQSQHRRNSYVSSPLQLHSRSGTMSLPRCKPLSLSSSPSFSSSPSRPIHNLSKRCGFTTGGAGWAVGRAGSGGGVPRSWARQYGSLQSGPCPSQVQPTPHSNPQTPQPHPPRPHPSNPPPSDHSPHIHQVFSLLERGEGEGLGQGQPSDSSRQERHRQSTRPLDAIGCLSIAMETGDEEDEWRREEEFSNMAATIHGDLQRGLGVRESLSPSSKRGSGGRDHTSPFLVLSSSRPGPYPRDSYPVTTKLQTSPSIQVPVSPSAPWLISNSRKRTLQDRTQFSDVDLGQLKRYWDRGMNSLGSVYREKINAAANQLNVDTEIVKTWIGNRRRKYRLMGIKIPPPKGGLALFQEGEKSPSALSSDGEGLRTPELGDNLNDGASFCLSEDGTSQSYQREEENGVEEESSSAPMAHSVLEEVQYLESQLENQNQRYYELETFTKSLLTAVRTNNLDRQQELLASLPQPADQDWDMSPEGGANSISITTHSADNHDSPLAARSNDETSLVNPNKDLPLVTLNEDGSLIAELNESSVSEELETETGPE